MRRGPARGMLQTVEKPKNTKETMAKLLRYFAHERNMVFGLMAIVVVMVICSVTAPKLQSEAIDQLTFGTFHGAIMAETAIGMLLAMRRGLLPGMGLCTTEAPWPEHLIGRRTISGSHAVILGYGNIGKAIGEKLAALGVTSTGITRKNLADLPTLLPQADALFLALPGTPETTNIIDAQELAALPPHAVIINVGRGNAINERALAQALNEQRLEAAFLDVTPYEPYPEDGLLRNTARCYLLPHASAFAPEYLEMAFEEWAEIYRTTFAR